MGWTIDKDATINSSGVANIPTAHSLSNEVYTIIYTDDNGCTGNTTYTVLACGCSNVSITQSSITIVSAGTSSNHIQVGTCSVGCKDYLSMDGNESWLHLEMGSNGEVYLYADANSGGQRTSTPSIKMGSNNCSTINVTQQAGVTPTCTCDDIFTHEFDGEYPYMVIPLEGQSDPQETSEYWAAAYAGECEGSFTIEVIADSDVHGSTDWIGISKYYSTGDDVYYYVVTAATNYETEYNRWATINVKTQNGTTCGSVKVKQLATCNSGNRIANYSFDGFYTHRDLPLDFSCTIREFVVYCYDEFPCEIPPYRRFLLDAKASISSSSTPGRQYLDMEVQTTAFNDHYLNGSGMAGQSLTISDDAYTTKLNDDNHTRIDHFDLPTYISVHWNGTDYLLPKTSGPTISDNIGEVTYRLDAPSEFFAFLQLKVKVKLTRTNFDVTYDFLHGYV